MNMEIFRRYPPHWIYFPNIEVACALPFVVWYTCGGSMCGVDGELCYFSGSDGVSCKTWLQMCWQFVCTQVPTE